MKDRTSPFYSTTSEMKIVDSKRDSGSIRSKRSCCNANNSVTRFARSGSSQGETKRPVALFLPNEPGGGRDLY